MKKKIQQTYASPAHFTEKEVHKVIQALKGIRPHIHQLKNRNKVNFRSTIPLALAKII